MQKVPSPPTNYVAVAQSSSMSSSLLTASPSTTSAPSSSKQPSFDDTCFKTPLPFNRKPRRGRGAASAAAGGGTRPNGYHSTGSIRGRGVGRPSGAGRAAAPQPAPPQPKFVLHDVACPHTSTYLGALSLPKFATVQPKSEIKEEVFDGNEVKASTSTPAIKEDVADERSDSGSGSSVILIENGECETGKEKTGEHAKENGATNSVGSSAETEGSSTSEDSKDGTNDKVPFVEEVIFDEYSLLLFTCVPDAQVFEKELEAVREREELEKKRIATEKALRIEKLKRKIRAKKRLIEKAARLQRKRLRGQKREKLRRERKSRHTLLKKTLRDAKAIQKAAAAAGSVVVVDKQLKKQWKAEQEADIRRREEKARKRVEHEARKEARRAKRDKKRGRKRRDPSKATKKGRETTAAAGGGAASSPIVGTCTGSDLESTQLFGEE
ncbi:hypothetical protein RB195_011808 [Necator americanus]|uniref:Uncharacterized protein n=1 Tax=Necator americanus TaxID=51031 RepID=A0ABR1D627_NECAM